MTFGFEDVTVSDNYWKVIIVRQKNTYKKTKLLILKWDFKKNKYILTEITGFKT